MLGESYEAKARPSVPDLCLSIVAASRYMLTILRERQRIHVKIVSLLFEYIGLGLPLPNKKLSSFCSTECQPFPTRIDGNRGYAFLRYTKGVDICETWHFPKAKEASRKSNDERVETCVERRADNLGVILVKEVSLADSPPRLSNLVGLLGYGGRASGSIYVVWAIRIFVCGTFCLPGEYCSITTNSIYLEEWVIEKNSIQELVDVRFCDPARSMH